jgi:hypothetical protein
MSRCFLFKALFIVAIAFYSTNVSAGRPLTWFLPDIAYDPSIPTPESFLGYQVGDWHINHALLVQYAELIAAKSGRAIVYEYARSHEHRPLIHLIITSERNQARLEEIRIRHLALTDPDGSSGIDISDMPVVVRLGYGVHGNEPSSHNAVPMVAYYLAAGQDDYVKELLENMVVIIDPSLNPDGQDRFASWVNRHKGRTPNPNPDNREFRDVWPGSRTNHYWFDLNRDWLPVQHPESYGRILDYHRWKPNVNTDHHEFGANSTFFFQPGIPSRINPRTPRRTDELTLEIGKFHARAFDRIGQLYYMQDDFDDFYYGKGSSYPDVNGSIGILFEQAGLNGHIRETEHGVIDFAETVRNQVVVSLSTMEASLHLRLDLLEHLRWFYISAIEEAGRESVQAYVFGDPHDQSRNMHLLDILRAHQIRVFNLSAAVRSANQDFSPGKAWLVPLKQPQYRLVQSIFETAMEFEDSLFYDVSTWTKPLAFNIPYGTITQVRQLQSVKGEEVTAIEFPVGRVAGEQSHYAYLFHWDDYYAPRALYFLQSNGLRTRVATEPLSIESDGEVVEFGYGSIMVPVHNQSVDADGVYRLLQEASGLAGITVYPVRQGLARQGIHLGSSRFAALEKPEVLMLIGQGVNSREAGEAWHLLDTRYHMPVTMVEVERLAATDLSRYNTLVMVSGSYGEITEPARQAISRWVRSGGTIIAFGTANNWLQQNDLATIEFVSLPEIEEPEFLPYNIRGQHYGARRIPGSIFGARIDITHPLGYGYKREFLPIYVSGNVAAKPHESPFTNPLMFETSALLSGYVFMPYVEVVNGSAGILTHSRGRGNVISIMDNPNFRGFWFGTNRLFMNAIFFGPIIRS